ncbi:hypothetical protein DFP73DRAFT_544686 [Morchella snyderi]|nr:hypothetical protein DFP73DRAFT_544686 [Morchella snyderi]
MFRNLKNFLSRSRIPVRISAQSDKYKFYRVRFIPQDKRFNGLFRGLLLLSGCHIAANIMLQTFSNGWEEPLFIPMGFLEEGPRRRYELTDPELQAFLKFNKDTKKALAARTKVIEILVKNLEANNRSKFGGDVKAEGSILYYHYPVGPPPEYIRKGLLISPVERDSLDQSEGASHPLRLSNLKYEWVSRPVPQNTMHRLSTALYPSWVFNSLYLSAQATLGWLQALKASGKTVDSMGDLVVMGTTTVKQGLGVTHRILQRTMKPPPPPRGHVVIDGIVQVSGNNLVVGIDIIASFDPETLGNLVFHKTHIRYVGKKRRQLKPVTPQSPPQSRPVGGKTTLVDDPSSKGTVQEAIQSSEEIRRRTIEQQRNFIDKQVGGVKTGDQKRVIQEPKVQDKGPESVPEIGVKPIVRMLKGKRGESIPDVPPGRGASERGDDKKQETDVDDTTSSKP